MMWVIVIGWVDGVFLVSSLIWLTYRLIQMIQTID